VDLKGRVVHVDPPSGEGEGFQVGIDFVEVDELDQALLDSFLDRERQKANA
jgi:hypothetical protein